MSKAYKCDRCGKLYEAKERTLEFKEHAVLKPHVINYEKIGNPDTYLSHVADLCPGCQSELEYWMSGAVLFNMIKDHKGNEYKSQRELAKAYGMDEKTLRNRLKKMSLEDALTKPLRSYNKTGHYKGIYEQYYKPHKGGSK